ncbi:MAG: DNA-processing protein DprA [Hyphomicrobiaceae bacterium]|nr:DNA-processing protein DprA [Hyphomicrobiaceae bacterium]
MSDARKQMLSDEERLNWLRLIRSDNVGPVTFHDLLNHFGNASDAIDALPDLSSRGGRRRFSVYPAEKAQSELEEATRWGASLAAHGEPAYPSRLARIDAPPPLIYVKGETGLLAKPIVAIVGARNASAIGQKFTRTIARDLGAQGFVIASGLARGIDTAAHIAALDAGTVSVLAGGINSIYPPENEELHQKIGTQGVLVSEMPFGYRQRGQDFPRRNRIIAGVCAGVIVVEAAKRSGSLITARLAGEMGREVFAVPGNPLDPRAAGANALLRDGAGLAVCADDVIQTLKPILGQEFAGGPAPMPNREDLPPTPAEIDEPDRAQVLSALGTSPVDIDELVRATNLSVRQVQIALLELDLAGRLQRHGNQMVSLAGGEGAD